MKIPKLLQSSANTEKVSMTIKGAVTGIVVILSFTGVIPADAMKEVGAITNFLVTGLQAITGVIATLLTVYGGLRKIYNGWANQ